MFNNRDQTRKGEEKIPWGLPKVVQSAMSSAVSSGESVLGDPNSGLQNAVSWAGSRKGI